MDRRMLAIANNNGSGELTSLRVTDGHDSRTEEPVVIVHYRTSSHQLTDDPVALVLSPQLAVLLAEHLAERAARAREQHGE